MSAPATAKQLAAINRLVMDQGGIQPWNLSDRKAILFLNDELPLALDERKPLRDQLTVKSASMIISQLTQ